jgi:2-amino-4-hydroxy-6-hydroxymethyldihydropteridine diphosphokinase
MTRCLLGIGANLGDPPRQIAAAVEQLAQRSDVRLQAISRNVSTPAVGGPPGQPPFSNAAVLIDTSLSPRELLDHVRSIERSLGRQPAARWDARLIDIDILLYGDMIVRHEGLRIPHPAIVARAFVLQPAAEIAPELRHPLVGWTMAKLWHHLQTAAPRFALVGCADQATFGVLADRVATDLPRLRFAPTPDQAPPPHAFAPVTDLPQQLKWLQQRAELLRVEGWNEATVAQPRLSPFWLDESLVWARATLGRVDRRRFEQEFTRLEWSIEPPKLVILATGFWPVGDQPGIPSSATLRADFRGQLIARGVCPSIEVETAAADDFVREVVGAMLAMQSPTEPIRR